MPRIIEYSVVLDRMAGLGLRCQYYNSGAFGFDSGVAYDFTGWLGGEDATIRPAAREKARIVPPPVEPTLTAMVMNAWMRLLPGPIWIMPKSQWAYELDHGSKAWLAAALERAGVDLSGLQGKTNSPAIEFASEESSVVSPLIESLLAELFGSDFALAFPDYPIACTLHHHKQVWWLSSNTQLLNAIDSENPSP